MEFVKGYVRVYVTGLEYAEYKKEVIDFLFFF